MQICHCFVPKKTITKQNPENGTKGHIKTTKQEVDKSKEMISSSAKKLPPTEHQAGLEEKSINVDQPKEGDGCLPKGSNKTGNSSSLTKTPSFLVNFRHTLEVKSFLVNSRDTLEVRTRLPPHATVVSRENNTHPRHIAFDHPSLKDLDLDKRLGVVETYMTVCTEGNYLRGEVDFLSTSKLFNLLSTSCELFNFMSTSFQLVVNFL